MAQSLPYLLAGGTVKTIFDRIRNAAVPDRVTKDFVNNTLAMKGGTGSAVLPFIKKIGLVASDGSPTTLYTQFRNVSTGGRAIADAIRLGYKPLTEVNENFFKLNDTELRDLIVQVTGAAKDASTTTKTLATLKALMAYADFDAIEGTAVNSKEVATASSTGGAVTARAKVGMNLSYTINLNLPPSTDQAVFNAIFKSLKEHLIPNEDG